MSAVVDKEPPPADKLSIRTLVACAVAAALVGALLVACDSGGGGATISYVCENGAAIAGDAPTADAAGCQSCNAGFQLSGTMGVGTSCAAIEFDGSFSLVGMATAFGVGEGFPTGLAAIGNTLYMVGQDRAVLYTVDTATGAATRVGSATNFGVVSEGLPTGLAAIGDTLYMLGDENDVLYTVDTATGAATRVGSATNFGVMSEDDPAGLAAIGNTLYMVGQGTAVLYTVDTTTTGAATQMGTLAAGFGVSEVFPRDMAAIGNTLYMTGTDNDALYRAEPLPPTTTP